MNEIERIYKVVNMQLTMHSRLHKLYLYRSMIVNILLIGSSFFLNILIFADYNYLIEKLSIEVETLRLLRSCFSILVFFLSLIIINIRWKEKGNQHLIAKNKLFDILQRCRSMKSKTTIKAKEILISDYKVISSSIISIPEKKFNKLKSIHYRKVEFSKFIEANKGIPWYLQKYRFYKKHI